MAALQVRPGAPEARQVRDDAQRALDQIDNVVRLKTSLLWDFKTPGSRRLAAQGVNLFVLDRTANRVFQLTLNEAGDGVMGSRRATHARVQDPECERPAGGRFD